MKKVSGGITAAKGFHAAGMHCGIKKNKQLDLALVLSEEEGPVAGMFTTNRSRQLRSFLIVRIFDEGLHARSSSIAGTPTPAPAPKAFWRLRPWR